MKPVLVTRQFPNMWKAIGLVAPKLALLLSILIGLPFLLMVYYCRGIPHVEYRFDWASSIFFVLVLSVILIKIYVWFAWNGLITIKAYPERLEIDLFPKLWKSEADIWVHKDYLRDIIPLPEIEVKNMFIRHEKDSDDEIEPETEYVHTAIPTGKISALEIQTSGETWIVGCPDPVEVSGKLRELYGLPKQPKEIET